MAIITRSELKAKFKNDLIPTQGDFKDLIDSSLNRKDDCFSGKWEPNRIYREGDVVLYGKSLYKLVLDGLEKDCPSDGQEVIDDTNLISDVQDDVSQQGPPTKLSTDDVGNGNSTHDDIPETICSDKPPGEDQRWCMLEFQVEDDDWEVIDMDGICVLTPKKDGALIGIDTGDDMPQGKVEINEIDKGQIILAPTDSIYPTVQIQNNNDGKGLMQLGEKHLEFIAQTPDGFAFYKKNKSDQQGKQKATPSLIVDANENGDPRIGIGATQPEANLDVKKEGKGQILLQAEGKDSPEIIVLNLDPKCYENYLITSVGEKSADFKTDADQGFKFKKGEEYALYKARGKAKNESVELPPEVEDPTLMTIASNGKVGIGTDIPTTHLEVKHETKGNFQMSFEKVNPVLSITNQRPGSQNKISIGADNSFGILMTDSSNGFRFKQREGKLKEGEATDINQGKDLMTLTPDHKLGVGVSSPTYHLDVAGKIRSNGLYVETNSRNIDVQESLSEKFEKKEGQTILGNLMELEAKIYKWKDHTVCANDGNHIGFFAHDVADLFPEAIKTHSDGTSAVAYDNLIGVLVEAVKAQQNQIDALTARVQKLEMNKY